MDMLNLGVKDTQMKTLLSEGIANGDIRVEGKARATRYFITPKAQILRTVNLDSYYAVETDKREMQTAYNFELIRDILPKVELFTADEYKFLADRESAFLLRMKDYPAEMYAKEMERLGIDLSWKSSEIEGNTYTLLETVNLLKDKIEAKGKKREEAIMLLNHKAALKAIVEQAPISRNYHWREWRMSIPYLLKNWAWSGIYGIFVSAFPGRAIALWRSRRRYVRRSRTCVRL